ncbi:MAG: hypothetical protein LBI01_06305 [Elusimicrobium sp.]|jgi:hypothetical protein|nr:hypothetical protein [Elusimicrobium sp.]
MKKLLVLITIILISLNSFAAEFAYVAKQDGKTVYVDTTRLATKVSRGAVLKFIESSEELKNYQGMSLGKIYKYGPSAAVTKAEDKYAVIILDNDYKTKPGQALELEAAAAPMNAAPADTPADKTARSYDGGIAKIFSSPAFDGKIISSCLSSRGGQNIFILATEQSIKAADLQGGILTEQAISPFKQVLTISCAPAKNNGRDQIFVVTYEARSEKLNTLVFELEDGGFTQTDTLKWAVKAVNTPPGIKLFGQEIFKHNETRFSPVGLINYDAKKGFYYIKTGVNAGSNATAFSFNLADLDNDGKLDAVFAIAFGRIKAALGKGSVVDVEDGNFASSPVRFTLANEIIRVLPAIPSFTQDEKTIFAAAENVPKAAIVAGSLGMYKSGILRFYRWDAAGLKQTGKIETGGVIYDLTAVNYNGAPAIMATEVFDSGVTMLNMYNLGSY